MSQQRNLLRAVWLDLTAKIIVEGLFVALASLASLALAWYAAHQVMARGGEPSRLAAGSPDPAPRPAPARPAPIARAGEPHDLPPSGSPAGRATPQPAPPPLPEPPPPIAAGSSPLPTAGSIREPSDPPKPSPSATRAKPSDPPPPPPAAIAAPPAGNGPDRRVGQASIPIEPAPPAPATRPAPWKPKAPAPPEEIAFPKLKCKGYLVPVIPLPGDVLTYQVHLTRIDPDSPLRRLERSHDGWPYYLETEGASASADGRRDAIVEFNGRPITSADQLRSFPGPSFTLRDYSWREGAKDHLLTGSTTPPPPPAQLQARATTHPHHHHHPAPPRRGLFGLLR